MRDKIADLIFGKFESIYCHNCRNSDSDNWEACEDCHRKYMMWQVSKAAAESLADDIMELFAEDGKGE